MSDTLNVWIEQAAAASCGRDRGLLESNFATEAARVGNAEGPGPRGTMLRTVLSALVERHRPRIADLRLPEPVKQRIEREYARVERNLAKAPDEAFDLGHHTLRCDFRIVCFGRIPVGVEHIELGGVPRSLLWKGSARQALQLGLTLARAGGAAPFYSAHLMHGVKPFAFLMAYNPETLNAWHHTVAQCLAMNPGVRGLIASSWWYDPQLTRFAPHLAFLRDGSLAHGAVLARAGVTEGARQFAIANSPERRQAVDSGAYVPESYSVVWSREALMKWAGVRSR